MLLKTNIWVQEQRKINRGDFRTSKYMSTVGLGLNLGMKGSASLTFPFKTNQHPGLCLEAQFSQSLFKNILLRNSAPSTWNFLSLVKYHSFLNLTPGLCLT